jgi:hypothetical protein
MGAAMRYSQLDAQDGRVFQHHRERPHLWNTVLLAILWLFLSLSLIIGMDRLLNNEGKINDFPMIFVPQENFVDNVNDLKPTLSLCVWQFPGSCV